MKWEVITSTSSLTSCLHWYGCVVGHFGSGQWWQRRLAAPSSPHCQPRGLKNIGTVKKVLSLWGPTARPGSGLIPRDVPDAQGCPSVPSACPAPGWGGETGPGCQALPWRTPGEPLKAPSLCSALTLPRCCCLISGHAQFYCCSACWPCGEGERKHDHLATLVSLPIFKHVNFWICHADNIIK